MLIHNNDNDDECSSIHYTDKSDKQKVNILIIESGAAFKLSSVDYYTQIVKPWKEFSVQEGVALALKTIGSAKLRYVHDHLWDKWQICDFFFWKLKIEILMIRDIQQ